MRFEPSRLRRGEVIAGAGAVVLLVSMFALPWYGLSGKLTPTEATLGVHSSVNGWDGLTNLRWLMLIAIACALALVYLQASRRAPALPVAFSVIVTVLALITLVALIYRVLINMPSSYGFDQQKAGAYVGLVSAAVVCCGGYLSMRQEGISPRDAPTEIETVRLRAASGR